MSTQTDPDLFPKNYSERSTQTEEFPMPGKASTPIKGNPRDTTNGTECSLSESFQETINPDKDPDYFPDTSMEDTALDQSNIVMSDRKFVVYESMLERLFNRLLCPSCGLPTPDDGIKHWSMGTSLHVKVHCKCGKEIIDWKAQPLLRKIPAFNLIYSATTLFSGL